jgi:MFS family permease
MSGGTVLRSSYRVCSPHPSACLIILTLICSCALQPLSAKVYQYFSLKWTYIAFLAIFELGSLICATAKSSVMLIVGRAVAGMGAAGLFSGALVIVSHMIPLRQRPSKSYHTGLI